MAQQVEHGVWNGPGDLGPLGLPADAGELCLVPSPGVRLDAPQHAALYVRALKPVLDRVGATLLLLVTLPIVLVVAAAVRLSMGRGVIFKQQRVGHHGRLFTMYKFRSMDGDRRAASTPFDGPDRRQCHKRDDDPRHTPVGRFLRRASIDELPQLWNVVKGDMSLVGPRPELPHIVADYQPWQHQRHQVKPGLTGFWQISSRAGGLAYEGVEFDIEYLEKVSLWTDLRVLLLTVPVTIRRTGC